MKRFKLSEITIRRFVRDLFEDVTQADDGTWVFELKNYRAKEPIKIINNKPFEGADSQSVISNLFGE